MDALKEKDFSCILMYYRKAVSLKGKTSFTSYVKCARKEKRMPISSILIRGYFVKCSEISPVETYGKLLSLAVRVFLRKLVPTSALFVQCL